MTRRDNMATDQTFVIVGASLTGAKAAEALREEGFTGRVVLIGEEAERPYDRPPLSKGYLRGEAGRAKGYLHPDHGVDLHLGLGVEAIVGDGRAEGVRTTDGKTLDADLVVVGVGVTPR